MKNKEAAKLREEYELRVKLASAVKNKVIKLAKDKFESEVKAIRFELYHG